jgi:hypothetical protein
MITFRNILAGSKPKAFLVVAIPCISLIFSLPERRVCGRSLRLRKSSQPTT